MTATISLTGNKGVISSNVMDDVGMPLEGVTVKLPGDDANSHFGYLNVFPNFLASEKQHIYCVFIH